MKLNLLWTDYCLWAMVVVLTVAIVSGRRRQPVRAALKQVFERRLAVIAFIVLALFLFIGLTDSIHFNKQVERNGKQVYSEKLYSVLDIMLAPLNQTQEKTYSAPFALKAYNKETNFSDGIASQYYPRLHYPPASLINETMKNQRIVSITVFVTLLTALVSLAVFAVMVLYFGAVKQASISAWCKQLRQHPTKLTALLTLALCLWVVALCYGLSREFHIFGTGKIGQDIFYYSIKSIRTGLIIGTITTLFMLPLAILMGISAGYFGGFIDDVIQYIYTTLSSIPGVLLIAASVLSVQLYIARHAESFPTLALRADARLLALCLILGVTSWTGLCRLLRAESLKLREVDYVLAARALGTKPVKIMMKHLLPNVMHIIIIAVVLDFSFLVLAEAVLSYVGVGVSPMTISWGNMINGARLELARDPIVWWPMASAFFMMFALVLAGNLFADAIRDAFDPRNTL